MIKRQFHTLSGLRGVAALFVVLSHLYELFDNISLPLAHTALDLFFLLSGVVIEASYAEKLHKTMSFDTFVKVRLIRLYPVYILGTLIMIVAMFVIGPKSSTFNTPHTLAYVANPYLAIPASVFMIPLLHYDDIFPFDPPAWSLFFELVANFIYARGIRYFTNKVLILIIILSLGGIIFANHNMPWVVFETIRVAFSFFTGVMLYRYYSKRYPGEKQLSNLVTEQPGNQIFSWSILAMVALLLSLQNQRYSTAIIAAAFPLLVYASLHIKTASKIFDAMGDMSYPLYLLHIPIFFLIFGVLHIRIFMTGTIFLLVLLALSWFIQKYYELPCRRYLKGLVIEI